MQSTRDKLIEKIGRVGRFLQYPVNPANITEGYLYSEHEKSIHGFSIHGGVDFAQPYGTKVYAAASGWAIASYHSFEAKLDNHQPRLYKSKTVRLGLGNFVMIYHPDASKVFEVPIRTEYAHLSTISSKIPFRNPRKSNGVYTSIGHKIPVSKLPDHPHAVWVEAGEELGEVGDSGLGWGYDDFPVRPDIRKFPSWDEVHLHFGLFTRVGSKQIKVFIDPYGQYATADQYHPTNSHHAKHQVLFK